MKKTYPLLLCLLISSISFAQNISALDLLEKSIAYHDPQANWPSFNGELKVTMTTPDGAARVSNITINLPKEYFSVTAKKDTTITQYTLNKGVCTTSIKEQPEKGKRTPCETAALYKNYYTYLYGLPMKLKDQGTNIAETVEKKTFKGKEYLVLKASYDATVGSDVWFFYFDPETYAMEIYQFFKTENGNIKEDSGEYILLSENKEINAVNMPKTRAWYYNKDDKYLGTDTLE
ncbi:hypothetical protein SCB49_07212 [unidentified eubacterium SCB49]|nr:hypothetical protein SCB49_07212 [unidentified eubacterium SCB49]